MKIFFKGKLVGLKMVMEEVEVFRGNSENIEKAASLLGRLPSRTKEIKVVIEV